MSEVVNKRIAVERGASLHVVGRAGAQRLNLDTNTVTGITCAELDRDAARTLRDALNVFLAESEDADDYWSPEPMSQASAEFMARQPGAVQ